MSQSSRLPGLYKKPVEERLGLVVAAADLTDEESAILQELWAGISDFGNGIVLAALILLAVAIRQTLVPKRRAILASVSPLRTT